MTTNHQTMPLFTLRTDELAGRQEEIQKLGKILSDLKQTSDQTLLFYIAGDGGMGKTRLLQWIAEQPLPDKTFCTGILDLANSILRTDVDLVEQIFDQIEEKVEQLPAPLSSCFAEYIAQRDRYRTQQAGATGGQARGDVIDAFNRGWLTLVKQGYHLIILLDTAELLRFEDDPVRQQFEQFGAQTPTASTKEWLDWVVRDSKQPSDETLPGVLFVVAGRRKEDETLYASLCELANLHATKSGASIINLAGLNVKGVDQYLNALAAKLQKENFAEQAEQIQEIDPALRTAFYHLTNGSPIALAIAVQIYIDQPSSDLESLVSEQLLSPKKAIPHAEKRLQNALVTALAERITFGNASSIAIRYMSLARKGLTPSRLRGILSKQAKLDPDTIFTELKNLIFVKQRPDGSLVLHDKVADWTQEGLYGEDDERSRLVYRQLVTLYDQEIALVEREIDQLSPKADPIESDEEMVENTASPSIDQDPFVHEKTAEFRLLRRKRRNLFVERMAYALRANPVDGYKRYFELAEEVFNVARMDYESQIRSEFLGWWEHQEPAHSKQYKYRAYAIAQGLREAYIRADFALRVAQREYNQEAQGDTPTERMQRFVALMEKMLEEAKTVRFQIPRFAQVLLAVYADTANGRLAESDEKIEQVRQSFNTHIAELNQLLQASRAVEPDDDEEHELTLDMFLILNALAFAYYERGYFERTHGNHGKAIESYTRSLLPYRELKFEINQARSLNDKAYTLAMVGDSDSAETAVADALRLRKRLGFSYLIGLSYNTLGIVRTMGDRPITAIRYCDYALRTFSGLSHEYGQMIASRALSEAYRRSAGYLQNDRMRQLHALEKAVKASEDARSIANDLLSDKDLLLAEILDECGCVYRDLARFQLANSDLKPNQYQNAYTLSETIIRQAIDIASKQTSGRSHLVDSMINLAYLSFYQIDREKIESEAQKAILSQTEQLIRDALAIVPSRYGNPLDPAYLATDLTVYWANLTKAHSLLVQVCRVRLGSLEKSAEQAATRRQLEDELLKESIYTLYFRSLLKGNVRNVRRSHQTIYEAFQGLTATTHRRLYKQAIPVSNQLGIPEQTIVEFLQNDFGMA